MQLNDRTDRPAQLTSSQRLHDLCYRVERLRPDYNAPHRFYEERSEIVNELSALARSV